MLAILWAPWKATSASSRGKLEVWGWSELAALRILYIYLNELRPFSYRGGILLTVLPSALVIIVASSPTTSPGKLLESRILRWIGNRSYSIYLRHWPVFMLSRPGIDIHLRVLLVRACQLVVTFDLAELGYRWIESPFGTRDSGQVYAPGRQRSNCGPFHKRQGQAQELFVQS